MVQEVSRPHDWIENCNMLTKTRVQLSEFLDWNFTMVWGQNVIHNFVYNLSKITLPPYKCWKCVSPQWCSSESVSEVYLTVADFSCTRDNWWRPSVYVFLFLAGTQPHQGSTVCAALLKIISIFIIVITFPFSLFFVIKVGFITRSSKPSFISYF